MGCPLALLGWYRRAGRLLTLYPVQAFACQTGAWGGSCSVPGNHES